MFILRRLTQGDPASEIFSVFNKNEKKGEKVIQTYVSRQVICVDLRAHCE